ncbi:MAG: serine protease [Bacteroidales bacterium]|nr:serine protease [Bacteroidales bacterium]
MKNTRLIELCEKYVNDCLNEQEKNELQLFVNASESNKQLFEENLNFIKELNNFGKYYLFEQNVKQVSRQYEESFKNVRKQFTLSSVIPYISVAAVSIVAVLFTLYVSGWFSYKQQIQAYRQLSNSITTISKNQKSLWNTLFSTNEITYVRGTAFAISSDGLLATSYHLVKDYDSVLVINASDSSVKMHAKLVACDKNLDIAILKISDSVFASIKNIPYSINYNFPVELGTYVYSLGFSKSSIVFGEGSISSFTGFNEDTNSIQVSIPTNPGNSGSPVFNQYGEVIGIICGKNDGKEGSTYALHSKVLKNILDSLSNNKFNRIYLKNTIKYLPKNKQVSKIVPYIFKIEIY